jgi:hypothetical protein
VIINIIVCLSQWNLYGLRTSRRVLIKVGHLAWSYRLAII